MVDNFVHVRLHELQADPETFIHSICQNYNIRKCSTFSPVQTVRGKGKVVYIPTVYPELTDEDRQYVIKELDLETEAMLGYC